MSLLTDALVSMGLLLPLSAMTVRLLVDTIAYATASRQQVDRLASMVHVMGAALYARSQTSWTLRGDHLYTTLPLSAPGGSGALAAGGRGGAGYRLLARGVARMVELLVGPVAVLSLWFHAGKRPLTVLRA